MTSPQEPHTTESKRVPTNLTNVNALSSRSQPAPEVEVTTTKSRLLADTSKAPRHALDSTDPPKSSTGLDMTTKSQKELQSTESAKILVEHEQEIERLEGKHKKEIERLEGKHEKEIERLGRKYEKEIERLEWNHEKEIGRLEGKHEKEIERLEGQHEKEIQRLEAIERLQTKVSTEEEMEQPKRREAKDPKSPDEKPINSSQAQATTHSSIAANQKTSGLDQSLPHTSASGKQTNTPPPQGVVPKADSLYVTDVANLVKALNAEIGKTVNLLMESPSEMPASDNKSEIDFDELRDYLGPWLCDKHEGKSESNPFIIYFTLQTGLANACSSVVNDSPFWCNGSILLHLYRSIAEEYGQASADEWRAKASNYFDLHRCEEANQKYLTEVLLKLVTAVGFTLESSKSFLSQHNQQVEVIAKSAAKLHKTITEDVTSLELITYTVLCDTEFDASQMEDLENIQGSTPGDKVICTHDMGLLSRKRVGPKKPRGSLKDWGVITKPKVVSTATLEGLERFTTCRPC